MLDVTLADCTGADTGFFLATLAAGLLAAFFEGGVCAGFFFGALLAAVVFLLFVFFAEVLFTETPEYAVCLAEVSTRSSERSAKYRFDLCTRWRPNSAAMQPCNCFKGRTARKLTRLSFVSAAHCGKFTESGLLRHGTCRRCKRYFIGLVSDGRHLWLRF